MAVTAKLFGPSLVSAFSGGLDWVNDTIKAALTSATYVPDQDVHDFFSDVTNEITGTGYTAGGKALTGKTRAYNAASNLLVLDAADLVWDSSTLTARRAVLYKDTGVASTSPLIGWVDFGQDISSTAGPFTITWDAGGIVAVSVS